MADDVTVTFAASIEKLTKGIGEATEALEGFAEPFSKLAASAGELGEAIAAAFAVERITHFFESMAELGTQTQRTAALLGISTTAVSGLDIAARASGGTLEGMTASLERFGLNLARGEAGSKQQEAALRALGLSAKDFIGVPLPDVLGKLADHFAVIKDGIDKDAIAMALLGRSGAQMIPIFNQGAEAFKEFAEMADRAGTAMSAETAAGFERTHLGLLELDKAIQGVSITVASIFKPAFDGVVRTITDLIEGFNRSAREGGAFGVILNRLGGSAKVLATAFVVAAAAVQELWEISKGFVSQMAGAFMGLGRVIKDVFTFSLGDLGAAFTALSDDLNARTKTTADGMLNIMRTAVGELKTIWANGADDQVKIEQTKVARIAIVNQQAVNAQMKAIDEEIKLYDEALKAKTILLDAEVKQHAISQNEKFGQLESYTDQVYRAELALLQREAQIDGLNVAQKQAVLNKIAQLTAKHDADMLKLDEQSIAAQQQRYESFFTAIEGGFNSQLRGLLAGTTTFGQAFKNIIGDMLIKFIEFCTRSVGQWAAAELAKTTATTTGAAARAAAEASGQGAGLLTTIANAIRGIMASAGLTTAEVTAAVAPAMGPAAPAAPAVGAAAGGATLAAALALLPSLDVGTDFVTRSGLAMIHEGEQIAPAQTSGPYSGGLGGGGPNGQGGSMVFAPNFSGFIGTQAMINQIMPQLARAFRDYGALNPSTVG